MTGYIFLISCLLAICQPIIFVQLPRFEIFERLLAENETETRSSVLRRRPLSPSNSREMLRRPTRPWLGPNGNKNGAISRQEKVGSEQVSRQSTGSRWYTGNSRPFLQEETYANTGTSTTETEVKKEGPDKKPWDATYERQSPRTQIDRKSLGNQHADMEDSTHEPLTQQLLPTNHVQLHEEDGVSQHCPKSPAIQSVTNPCTGPRQDPSLLDESGLPLESHSSRSALRSRARGMLNCPCPGCRHPHTEASIPQSSNATAIAPDAATQSSSTQALKGHTCFCQHEKCKATGVQLLDRPLAAPKATLKTALESARKAPKPGRVLWQDLQLTVGFMILTFAFAILVAHCLAWFLVYKTEARLGEVRSGLLRGGEMKLCLCGKG